MSVTTGEKIKTARKKAGLTQRELGGKIGVSYQTLAQWENDLRKPKPETLQRIASALEVKWYDLLPDDQKGAGIKGAGLTFKDKAGSGTTVADVENMPTDELISAIKARLKKDPHLITKLNEAMSAMPPMTDNELIRIAEADGIPVDFVLSERGKQRIAEVKELLSTISSDGVQEWLEYLRYISYRQEHQPPQDTPTTTGGTDTPPPENPAEGSQGGK